MENRNGCGGLYYLTTEDLALGTFNRRICSLNVTWKFVVTLQPYYERSILLGFIINGIHD